jgi:hypothetical protein
VSVEARLRRGFERATENVATPVDVALATVVANYRAQRRQRGVLLVAAAIAGVVMLIAGDDALRWVQTLDRQTAPAERSRETGEETNGDVAPDAVVAENADPNEPVSETEPRRAARRRARIVPPAVTGGARPQRGAVSDEGLPADDEEEPRSSTRGRDASRNRPDLSRVVSRHWSHTPDGNSGVATFRSALDEVAIRVRLELKGGGGTSGLEADLYEIVGGEESHVANFCSFETYSPPFEITPGARIEVRVSSSGCNGTDLAIKGTATVAFYE